MGKNTGITPDDVAQIARLARLELTDEEMRSIGEDLNGILGYINSLQALDLDGVEPTATGSAVNTPLRADQVHTSLPRDVALAQSADQDGTGFTVPRVVG